MADKVEADRALDLWRRILDADFGGEEFERLVKEFAGAPGYAELLGKVVCEYSQAAGRALRLLERPEYVDGRIACLGALLESAGTATRPFVIASARRALAQVPHEILLRESPRHVERVLDQENTDWEYLRLAEICEGLALTDAFHLLLDKARSHPDDAIYEIFDDFFGADQTPRWGWMLRQDAGGSYEPELD